MLGKLKSLFGGGKADEVVLDNVVMRTVTLGDGKGFEELTGHKSHVTPCENPNTIICVKSLVEAITERLAGEDLSDTWLNAAVYTARREFGPQVASLSDAKKETLQTLLDSNMPGAWEAFEDCTKGYHGTHARACNGCKNQPPLFPLSRQWYERDEMSQ